MSLALLLLVKVLLSPSDHLSLEVAIALTVSAVLSSCISSFQLCCALLRTMVVLSCACVILVVAVVVGPAFLCCMERPPDLSQVCICV